MSGLELAPGPSRRSSSQSGRGRGSPGAGSNRSRAARQRRADVVCDYALGLSRTRSLLQRNAGNEVQLVIDDLLQLASDGQTELRALLTDMRASALTSGDLVRGLTNLAAICGLAMAWTFGSRSPTTRTCRQQSVRSWSSSRVKLCTTSSSTPVPVVLTSPSKLIARVVPDNRRPRSRFRSRGAAARPLRAPIDVGTRSGSWRHARAQQRGWRARECVSGFRCK